jgi:hypothetical protein
VLLVRHLVECLKFLRAGFSVIMQRAFATTAVTHPSLPVKGEFTLLKRSPDSSRYDNLAVISLCVLSAGRVPRSSAGFKRLLFESNSAKLEISWDQLQDCSFSVLLIEIIH